MAGILLLASFDREDDADDFERDIDAVTAHAELNLVTCWAGFEMPAVFESLSWPVHAIGIWAFAETAELVEGLEALRDIGCDAPVFFARDLDPGVLEYLLSDTRIAGVSDQRLASDTLDAFVAGLCDAIADGGSGKALDGGASTE